jgi:hypothetical protein
MDRELAMPSNVRNCLAADWPGGLFRLIVIPLVKTTALGLGRILRESDFLLHRHPIISFPEYLATNFR